MNHAGAYGARASVTAGSPETRKKAQITREKRNPAVWLLERAEAKQEAVRISALGRNELALGKKESAAELAKKAVWLDPTADGPKFLYLQTHGCLPRITLSGVEDEK